jgi:hypothetical protein
MATGLATCSGILEEQAVDLQAAMALGSLRPAAMVATGRLAAAAVAAALEIPPASAARAEME